MWEVLRGAMLGLWIWASTCAPTPAQVAAGCVRTTTPATETPREPELEPDLPCLNPAMILAVEPEVDDEDLFTDEVLVTFDAFPDWAELSLVDGTGASIEGTTSVDGRFARFVSDHPFPPSTEVTATLVRDCQDPISWSFSTGPIGDPVADLSALVGQPLWLDPAGVAVEAPEPVADLIRYALLESDLLFALTEVGEADARFEVGTGTWDEDAGAYRQDLCQTTDAWSVDGRGAFEDPHVLVDADETTLTLAGATGALTDLRFDAWYVPDEPRFVRGRLDGLLDTRTLGALVGHDSAGAVCEEVVRLGSACVPCADGGDYCLPLVLREMTASADGVAEAAFVTRTDADIAADPACP